MGYWSVTILIVWWVVAEQRCISSSLLKYELAVPSELLNYYATCSEFSKRTCCSIANMDQIAKKIYTIFGMHPTLSHSCRALIATAFCSICDADIGEAHKSGICPVYCGNIFSACKDDYFAMDIGNDLRACREEDVVCSQLQHIPNSGQTICQLLSLRVGKEDCWNGEVSALTKGRGSNKVATLKKDSKVKRRKEKGWWDSLKAANQYVLALWGLGIILVGALLCFLRQWFRLRSRQLRYL